jgi:hypothetical protein
MEDKAKGKMKEAAGAITGDEDLKAEGRGTRAAEKGRSQRRSCAGGKDPPSGGGGQGGREGAPQGQGTAWWLDRYLVRALVASLASDGTEPCLSAKKGRDHSAPAKDKLFAYCGLLTAYPAPPATPRRRC